MADEKDRINLDGDSDLIDEDFDYQKEIEEIEAQERELAARRAQKQKELEERRLARENAEAKINSKGADRESKKEARKEESRKERELRERKKESEWLGEPFDEDDTAAVSMTSSGKSSKKSSKKKKKKSKAGIFAVVVILLLLAIGGGAYAIKSQADSKTISDFQAKVSSFQTEKLDGADLGSNADYFNDFMTQCEQAIADKDISKINELNKEWADMETKLSDAQTGKASVEAFAKTAEETLAKYQTTDDTKDQYDTFMADLKKAQEDNDSSQIETLQTELDKLVTALKAADIKEAQQLKNTIADLDLDSNYVSDDQQKTLDEYAVEESEAESNEDYATQISTLQKWLSSAQEVQSSVDTQKKESTQKASSEAAVAQSQVAQQSEAAAQAQAAAESKQQAAASSYSGSSSSGSSSSGSSSSGSSSSGSSSSGSSSSGSTYSYSGDYVFPNSSSVYLTNSDLRNLTSAQLVIARNEIYARHGRLFDDKGLQAYFNSKSWYKGTVKPDDFTVSVFNDCEKSNIMLIREYEQNH